MPFLKKLGRLVGGGDSTEYSPEDLCDARILRGQLEISILDARDLPDTDNMLFGLNKLIDSKDVTDSYVTAHLDTCRILMTSVKDNTLNPVWNEKYIIPVCHYAQSLIFRIRDKDHLASYDIGEVLIRSDQLVEEGEVSGYRDIINRKGRVDGQLNFSVVYRPADQIPKDYEIDAYFPMRGGNHVTLYSCARNSPVPVMISNGDTYKPASCYLDMYRALVGARKLIYITGWSVWTKLHLVREDDVDELTTEEEREHADKNLGELLITKAQEGVKVLMMIWSEITTGSFNNQGMMGTHDQETYDFFRGSAVQCCLIPREIGKGDLTDLANHQLAAASYTHHQKSIIVDSDPLQGDDRRTLTAFVGGLDLTDGRYDTPDHPLYKSLTTYHKDDFYQNSCPGVAPNHGPRQPWQDIHSKIVGPTAWDVLTNFADRWSKQARQQGPVYQIHPDEFNSDAQFGDWKVQFLRSITNDSTIFSNQMREYTLTVKKSRKIDESIVKAYISAIRAAEKYIYIENQYFLGSAYAWSEDTQINCHHIVPAEIAQKIVDKIYAGEEFRAYIVIPLHPEGDPATMPLQEILAWQRRTMEMMYKEIAQALQIVGSGYNPANYLVFLCLANRETEADIPEELDEPDQSSKAFKLREYKRFMIYVHSKLLIVDDSLAIIGSANINQRSLGGSRDTEMAVMVHQDELTYQSQRCLPDGEVSRFRMRLFEEHLGSTDSSLVDPSSEDCVQFVQRVTRQNWEDFTMGEDVGMTGHAVPYPIEVQDDGRITELEGFPCFPDTEAPVAGCVSSCLPMKLTT